MNKFYIAIEQAVYRHKTLGASLNKEDLLQVAIDYFKTTDDYHIIEIEEVVIGGDAVVVEEYSVKSEERKVWKCSLMFKRNYLHREQHGKRTVTNQKNEVVAVWDVVYELKDGEEWAE